MNTFEKLNNMKSKELSKSDIQKAQKEARVEKSKQQQLSK